MQPSLLSQGVSRRQFIQTATTASLLAFNKPTYAISTESQSIQAVPELTGKDIYLTIAEQHVNFTGNMRTATTVNGSLPAPTLRFKEGDTVRIHVTNQLKVDTSIHWHGILLPYQMDGVPGISFAGIKPNETFTYEFTLKQHGTYWYHAHSGFQEQTGLMGALIIDPIEEAHTLVQEDCEHTLILSDWTDLDPTRLLAKLKKNSSFDNQHQPTLIDFYKDTQRYGLSRAWTMRKHWQSMRMSPTDFSDLSAKSLTYLLNGRTAANCWTGVFKQGQQILLRVINASAATIFDVRIPNLKLTVVASDGQAVKPVTVDEFRIGGGETYDILITPTEPAYTFFAQSIDRSGFICGTLTSKLGLTAPIPQVDNIEKLTMTDMMGDMDMQQGNIHHAASEKNNPFVEMRIDTPRSNLDDAGINLRHNNRRVLTYADLISLNVTDTPPPTRQIELHLTGNMQRYVWGINGLTDAEASPLKLIANERIRITYVNDTMMTHPMHLHGMWSDIVGMDGHFKVRKHTVMIQPAQQISIDVTAIQGKWALHCHLFYHMANGMFRTVEVV